MILAKGSSFISQHCPLSSQQKVKENISVLPYRMSREKRERERRK
jgi:ABC-type lipoprotein export system ATPase subunit